jgi:rhodanese-related sulfurtransferase
MFNRVVGLAAVAGCLVLAGPVGAYDEDLAASYARLFEPVAGAKAGKSLHLMKPDVLVTRVKAGESVVMLDVRTPAETALFTATVPGALSIPLNRLFTTENLARVPTDTPVVVLCKSGTRATAAGVALRHIGFDNVFILKGGFKALNAYLDPRTANLPPAPIPAK